MKTAHTWALIAASALLAPAALSAQSIHPTQNEQTMSIHKETVRKLYEDALNKRNMALLQEIVSPEFTGPGGQKGAAAFEATLVPLISAFPDIQWKIVSLVAEADKVAMSWQVRGTHTAQFAQYPATGKNVTSTGMGIHTLKDGKIIHSEILTDRLGFLQALEILPAQIPAPAAKKDR